MKSESEIRAEILDITVSYAHILSRGPATSDVNLIVASMQIIATAKLDSLFWTLGERRPRFTCDDDTKVNM